MANRKETGGLASDAETLGDGSKSAPNKRHSGDLGERKGKLLISGSFASPLSEAITDRSPASESKRNRGTQFSSEELINVQRSVEHVRKNIRAMIVYSAVFDVLFLIGGFAFIEGWALIIVGVLLVLQSVGIAFYAWRNWRCPACSTWLGTERNRTVCQSCGVPLY